MSNHNFPLPTLTLRTIYNSMLEYISSTERLYSYSIEFPKTHFPYFHLIVVTNPCINLEDTVEGFHSAPMVVTNLLISIIPALPRVEQPTELNESANHDNISTVTLNNFADFGYIGPHLISSLDNKSISLPLPLNARSCYYLMDSMMCAHATVSQERKWHIYIMIRGSLDSLVDISNQLNHST
ncbi:uncharacterized protein MELLADRAFT_105271 [Melampsora larici-populina 98AG31]|uniref:Uncharacterized protein n=1 Tax=Melampsora larici-populina (strain 98AG31 / pathotype 3-4-7) TaxID=747676 RepID=F4RHK0_MELLP|nr:uncharacterized protein MELLADRAFT_105271 [Melampsora larici-populina 98AG31]EGG08251.1 hypothetical protein MELLADRAFT_105271 [Melampsora larici-populina 98AG31]